MEINITKIKKSLGGMSFTTLTIILLAAINIFGYYFFHRFDFTAEKSYTVSSATINILHGIKDPIKVKLFISKNLPADYQTVAEYVDDMIKEYQKYSGKLEVERLDPIANPDQAAEASKYGIQPLQLQILDKDEYKVQKGFLGIAFVTGDDSTDSTDVSKPAPKQDSIPFIQSQENLEYELTSIIRKLSSDQLPTIAFTTGHDESGLTEIPPQLLSQFGNLEGMSNGDYSEFGKNLDKSYQTKPVSLTKAEELDGVSLLVVGGPKKDFSETELYNLDQYILKGGKVIFLVDRVAVDPSKGLQPEIQNDKLAEFIANYGVQINKDLVVDKNNETVSFNSGQTQYIMPYPYWVKIVDGGFSKSNPATSKIPTASLPFVSSLTGNKLDGVTLDTLVSSSAASGTVSEPFNLAPDQKVNLSGNGSKTLAIEAKGSFISFFKGKDLPKAGKGETVSTSFAETSSADGQLIVFGDADFLKNDYSQRNAGNLSLGLNLVDYMASGNELISIRNKSLNNRVIRQAEGSEITWVRIINIGMVPAAVLLLGLWRFNSRKRDT